MKIVKPKKEFCVKYEDHIFDKEYEENHHCPGTECYNNKCDNTLTEKYCTKCGWYIMKCRVWPSGGYDNYYGTIPYKQKIKQQVEYRMKYECYDESQIRKFRETYFSIINHKLSVKTGLEQCQKLLDQAWKDGRRRFKSK